MEVSPADVLSICIAMFALFVAIASVLVNVWGHTSRNTLTREQIDLAVQKEMREREEIASAKGAAFEASFVNRGNGEYRLRLHNTGRGGAEKVEVSVLTGALTVMQFEYEPADGIPFLLASDDRNVLLKYEGILLLPVIVQVTWREGERKRQARATFKNYGPEHIPFYS